MPTNMAGTILPSNGSGTFHGYETRTMRIAILCAAECSLPRWNHDALARPYWRLYWNPAPGWEVHHERRRIPVEPGRILLIAPETVYTGVGLNPATHVFLHFTCDELPGDPLPMVHELPCQGSFIPLLAQLRSSTERTLDAAALALHALARLPATACHPRRASGPVAEAQALALRFIHRAVSNEELARAAGMHVNAFIRRFRNDTGETPRQWQLRRRIDAACVALEKNVAIDVVAERLGFCDRHHLTRVFTRMRGCGPATYRESTRQSA